MEEDATETTQKEIRWEPKVAAARDLILVALDRNNGRVKNDSGRTVTELLTLCKVDGRSKYDRTVFSTAIRLMEQTGLVVRTIKATRTYEVKQVRPLTAEEVAILVAAEADNRKVFQNIEIDSKELPSMIDDLVHDYERAYEAIQLAARGAKRTEDGRVAISVKGVLGGIGIRGDDAKRIRYYLKKLNDAKSAGPVAGKQYLFWWRITDRPFNPKLLIEMASGKESYERDKENRVARSEDTGRERDFAGSVPAILTNGMCSPVETRQITDPAPAPGPSPLTMRQALLKASPTSTTVPAKKPESRDNVDFVERLIEICEGLEAEKEKLRNKIETLTVEKAMMVKKSEQEIDGLRTHIEQLEAELNLPQSSALRERAEDLIARHTRNKS